MDWQHCQKDISVHSNSSSRGCHIHSCLHSTSDFWLNWGVSLNNRKTAMLSHIVVSLMRMLVQLSCCGAKTITTWLRPVMLVRSVRADLSQSVCVIFPCNPDWRLLLLENSMLFAIPHNTNVVPNNPPYTLILHWVCWSLSKVCCYCKLWMNSEIPSLATEVWSLALKPSICYVVQK